MKDKLADAPIGAKAPATLGGYWIKVDGGWKWYTGAIFTRPGGDWTGKLIYPSTPTRYPHNPVASSRDGRVQVNPKDNDLKLVVLACIKKVKTALNITEVNDEI